MKSFSQVILAVLITTATFLSGYASDKWEIKGTIESDNPPLVIFVIKRIDYENCSLAQEHLKKANYTCSIGYISNENGTKCSLVCAKPERKQNVPGWHKDLLKFLNRITRE